MKKARGKTLSVKLTSDVNNYYKLTFARIECYDRN